MSPNCSRPCLRCPVWSAAKNRVPEKPGAIGSAIEKNSVSELVSLHASASTSTPLPVMVNSYPLFGVSPGEAPARSEGMNGAPPLDGVARSSRVAAYPPPPHVAAYVDSAVLIVRIDPIADDSLADILALKSAGMAIEAMMPMMATTMSNSINVKPRLSCRTLVSLMSGRLPGPN